MFVTRSAFRLHLQHQLSVIHNRKTNAISQCIFCINICRQLYVLVEAGSTMLSIDLQGGNISIFLIPLPRLNIIMLYLGCRGKRELSVAPTELPNICTLVCMFHIFRMSKIFSPWLLDIRQPGQNLLVKRRPLWSIQSSWNGFSRLVHHAHCPSRAKQSHSPHCQLLHTLESNKAERWTQPATGAENFLLLPSLWGSFP